MENEIQFVLKVLKNELLRKIKINFMVVFTSMVYTLFKNKFVSSSLRFSAVQWSHGYQSPLFRKLLMYFNVYMTGRFVLFL